MFCIEFLPARFWVKLILNFIFLYLNNFEKKNFLKVSFWVLMFTVIMLASEFVFVIHYVTRFTEEIFAFLIAIVFLADAIKKIFYVSFF